MRPAEARQLRCRVPRQLDEDSLHYYDVIRFEPHLAFSFADQTVSGYCKIKLTTDEPVLGRLDFRFTHSLVIDSIWTDENHTTTFFGDGDDSIQVFISPSLQSGDTITVGIAYHGTPEIVDIWGGFRWATAAGFRPAIAFSLGDGLDIEPPPANFTWFPCHSAPYDNSSW